VREVAAHDQAPTAVEPGERVGGHGAGIDVGVVDHGPDGLAAFLLRHDLRHPLGDPGLDDGEDLLDRAPGRCDAGPQGRLDLPDRRLQVGRRGLPVRQGRHAVSFGEDSLLERR